MTEQAFGHAAEREELDAEGTALLKALGAFQRGSGIQSPRREREQRYRTGGWNTWVEDEVVALGSCQVWDEMDAVAAAAGLTAMEKAALSLSRVEGYSIRAIAKKLDVTTHRVRRLLAHAHRKCMRRSGDLPCSAASLFWQEVRQKQASIYRPPSRCRRATRRGG